jgi:hypothetical protein
MSTNSNSGRAYGLMIATSCLPIINATFTLFNIAVIVKFTMNKSYSRIKYIKYVLAASQLFLFSYFVAQAYFGVKNLTLTLGQVDQKDVGSRFERFISTTYTLYVTKAAYQLFFNTALLIR